MPRKPPGPEERQRRRTRRSRNGCITCKAKHIKCDENRPLCSYCLKTGQTCRYSDRKASTFEIWPAEETEPRDAVVVEETKPSILDMLPRLYFVGYPVEIPEYSRLVFDFHLSRYPTKGLIFSGPGESCVINRALAEPALLNAALLTSTVQYLWYNEPNRAIQQALIYHKLETMRFVNKQLQNVETAGDDVTIACIGSLALVESALGSREVAKTHLSGLSQIVELKDPQPARAHSRIMGKLMSIIGWSLGERRIEAFTKTCQMYADMAPAGSPQSSNGDGNGGDNNSTSSGSDSGGTGSSNVSVAPVMNALGTVNAGMAKLQIRDQAQPAALPASTMSRAGFVWCYMYLLLTLQREETDIFIVSFCVESLLIDINASETAVLAGRYPPCAWMRSAVFGLCVLAIARIETPAERLQVEEWRETLRTRIARMSQLLHVEDWETAREAFFGWVWAEGVDREPQLKGIWEDAFYRREGSTEDAESV